MGCGAKPGARVGKEGRGRGRQGEGGPVAGSLGPHQTFLSYHTCARKNIQDPGIIPRVPGSWALILGVSFHEPSLHRSIFISTLTIIDQFVCVARIISVFF